MADTALFKLCYPNFNFVIEIGRPLYNMTPSALTLICY